MVRDTSYRSHAIDNMENGQGKSRGLGNGGGEEGAAEQSPGPLLPCAEIWELKRGEFSKL